MSSIGDKKVALNLSDGTSVNLNKPKVLPDTITKFADITEIGWYKGTIQPTGQFPNRTCQISDCPDALPSYPYTFTLFVFDSRLNNTGMSYVYFGYDSMYVGTRNWTKDEQYDILWRLLSSKEEILENLIIDNLTSTDTDKALSANQGKVLNDKISNLTKSDVGLDKVNNTADADKSVKSATTATTATKLGSSTVGSATKPIYLNAGTATASSSTVGSSTKPVYLNSGTITAASSTVGGAAKPVYMSSGTVTACSSTVGSAARPVYMNAGTLTAGTYTFSVSTTDLTAGTSSLTTNEIRFIYE